MRESKRTLTDDPIVLRIMNLLKSKKKTDKELSDHLELTHGITTAWKYGGSKSYRPHINEIAKFWRYLRIIYFAVSMRMLI